MKHVKPTRLESRSSEENMNPDDILRIMEDSEGKTVRVIDTEFEVFEGTVTLYDPPSEGNDNDGMIVLLTDDGVSIPVWESETEEIEFID